MLQIYILTFGCKFLTFSIFSNLTLPLTVVAHDERVEPVRIHYRLARCLNNRFVRIIAESAYLWHPLRKHRHVCVCIHIFESHFDDNIFAWICNELRKMMLRREYKSNFSERTRPGWKVANYVLGWKFAILSKFSSAKVYCVVFLCQ